jgi:aminoglycoside 2'-N-acetyltransferase I
MSEGASRGLAQVPRPRLRTLPTPALRPAELAEIRALLDAAFGTGEDGFGDDDWAHSLGGVHVVADLDGRIVSHASVVERTLEIGERTIRTGYVEAVATAPDRQGQGLGTRVMRLVAAYIEATFELGALGTGSHHFYERLGWLTWAGPAFVRTPEGPRRTPDDEGYILVLRTPTSPPFGLAEPIRCEWRPGDVW